MEDKGAGEAPPIPSRKTKLPKVIPRPLTNPATNLTRAETNHFLNTWSVFYRAPLEAKMNEAPAKDDENQRDREFEIEGLWRWDKRPNLHKTGMKEGSDAFIDGKYIAPLNNPTYGDKTIYAAASRDGARGFLESEMLSSYLGKKKKPMESETWHLYKIYPTPEMVETIIDLSEFRPLDRLKPWSTHTGYLEKDRVLAEPEFEDVLDIVPQLTRKQQGKLLTHLNAPSAGNKVHHWRKGKIYSPRHYVPMPRPDVLSTPEARWGELSDEDAVKLAGYLNDKGGRMTKILEIALFNAQATDEVQLEAPIPAERMTYQGSVEFKPEHWSALRKDFDITKTLSKRGEKDMIDFSKGNEKARREGYVPKTEKLSQEIGELLDRGDVEFIV